MRKNKFRFILTMALLLSMLMACSSGKGDSKSSGGKDGKKELSDIEVVFIPKMTGNAFFESGNNGAQKMAKEQGFKVKYDGSPEGTVANQVQIINSAVSSGADAIAISSVTSDGLNQ